MKSRNTLWHLLVVALLCIGYFIVYTYYELSFYNNISFLAKPLLIVVGIIICIVLARRNYSLAIAYSLLLVFMKFTPSISDRFQAYQISQVKSKAEKVVAKIDAYRKKNNAIPTLLDEKVLGNEMDNYYTIAYLKHRFIYKKSGDRYSIRFFGYETIIYSWDSKSRCWYVFD